MSGFYVHGGRTPGDLIELTIRVLEGKGDVEIEDDEQMDALVVQLADTLKRHEKCITPADDDPYARDAEQLAACWAQDRMWAWEQRAPRFECACGVTYGLENSGSSGHVFYALTEHGTFTGYPVEECRCGRDLASLRDRRREAEETGMVALFE